MPPPAPPPSTTKPRLGASRPLSNGVSAYSTVPQSPLYNPSPLNPNYQTSTPAAGGSGSSSGVHRSGSNGSSGRTSSDEHYSPQDSLSGSSRDSNAVANQQVGSAFGPYAYQIHNSGGSSGGSTSAPGIPGTTDRVRSGYASSRMSMASEAGFSSTEKYNVTPTTTALLYDAQDPEMDDDLHNPDPAKDSALDRQFTFFSARGWLNVGALVFIAAGLVALFAAYPVISYATNNGPASSNNNYGQGSAASYGSLATGFNASARVAMIRGIPQLIDPDTPSSVKTRVATDGTTYQLQFSDEFNKAGRTFYPGDDPFWTALDLYYGGTRDLEYYSPDAITTNNGQLQITMTNENIHNLMYKSGMLQSWNQLCFTGGIMEVSVSLPGKGGISGLWPAIWTMGNLGRAGYPASTDGVWPYSYEACDAGILPNQTNGVSTLPTAYSYIPGQKLNSCTCSGGDHPNTGTGRGAPEIDVFEAQADTNLGVGQASQSVQIAPFNAPGTIDGVTVNYAFTESGTTIAHPSYTAFNNYRGGTYQQAVSAVTELNNDWYNGTAWQKYAFEWHPQGSNSPAGGQINWFVGGDNTVQGDGLTWTMNAAAIGPDTTAGISSRLVSKEPMYMIMNTAISTNFGPVDYANLQFPATMFVDYVRIYQDPSKVSITCDPPNYPTMDYINNHINAYTNQNLTTWSAAGYTFPSSGFPNSC